MKVLTTNGFKKFDGVKITYNKKILYVIKTNKNKEIKCTPDHLLRLKNGSYEEAKRIVINDVLFTGEIVIDMKIIPNNKPVYDLINVQDGNHYLTNGLSSHNCVFMDECITGEAKIKIKNKETNEIIDISLEEFWNMISCDNFIDKKLTNKYQVLTPQGWKDFDGIKRTKNNTIKFTFDDGTIIETSYDHKFVYNNDYIKAKDVEIGLILSGKKVSCIQYSKEKKILYDLLNTGEEHQYYANDIAVSNCAFVPKNLWQKFFVSTWPTISSGKDTRFIIVSTPNGRNHFYEFWTGAVSGKNNFYPIEVSWWDVPGRDEKWREEQLMAMSEDQFMVEYGNSFDSTSNTLIAPDKFRTLENNITEPIQSIKTTRIYELPEKDHTYFMSVDCADVGDDFSTISVIDITKYPYKQVAVYADNKISHLSFPQVIYNMGVKYNNARVLVESNDIGNTILHILNYDLDYEYIVRTSNATKGRSQLGQRTTIKTKAAGCARLKDMVESYGIIIKDSSTLSELRHFVISGRSYAAETGYHDDLVMGLVNFAYYASTPQFRVFYDSNFSDEFREQNDKEIMEGLTPLPLFGSILTDIPEMSKADYDWLKK